MRTVQQVACISLAGNIVSQTVGHDTEKLANLNFFEWALNGTKSQKINFCYSLKHTGGLCTCNSGKLIQSVHAHKL